MDNLVDFHRGAIGHCGCGTKANRLPGKAALSEEIALVQNTYCGFLPGLRHNRESHLSFLYVENGIGRVALGKNCPPLWNSFDLSTAVDGPKECLGVELDGLLGRRHGRHKSATLKSF
jgi:hypothetical protein